MDLSGERLIQAPRERTWQALNDPEVLRACIPGCESLEATGPDAFAALIALKVGPVSAKFKGVVRLSDVVPPSRYTLHFDGQGGVAGFGKGEARLELLEEDGAQTRLRYQANAKVGGKIAQIGSRLVDATAAKLAEDFFKRFEARMAEEGADAPAVASDTPSPTAAQPVSAELAGPSAGSSKRWLWAGAVAAAALVLVVVAVS